MERKKRILLIAPMPPLIGGIAVSVGRLYENLQADGYDVDYYDIKLKRVFRFLWIPVWILFHRRFDIVHCHVSGTFRKWYLALMKPCFKGARLIFTLHGDVTGQLHDRRALWAYSRADRIICVQPGDARRLPEPLPSRSVDIPAFILPRTITDRDIPAEVLDFVCRRQEPLILFYGGTVLTAPMYDLYGIRDALDVYRQVTGDGLRVRMLMIISSDGSRESRRFLGQIREAALRDLRDPSLFRMVENVSMPMLPLFRHADLYLRPTKTDGDSLAVREALSQHCPVVASDRSVRPAGTAVYHTPEEFRRLVAENLRHKTVPEEQPNFYQQIVKQYEYEP